MHGNYGCTDCYCGALGCVKLCFTQQVGANLGSKRGLLLLGLLSSSSRRLNSLVLNLRGDMSCCALLLLRLLLCCCCCDCACCCCDYACCATTACCSWVFLFNA